jgi:predicted nicotinamide N-methyase
MKRFTEDLGPLKLELETLADLDQAIDKLCEDADANKEGRIYEDLCPYFGVVWPAARALSQHLARMGGWLKGKTVLELGCGLAIPSLVAAKLGAKVTATDFHPDVPKFLSRNLELNGLSPDSVTYRSLDWHQAQGAVLGTFEFVVGSDVLYEAKHPESLARQLASHCARDGHVLLSDPGRVYLQKFMDEMTVLGFRGDTFVREVADGHSDRAGDKATREVFVIALQRK